MNRLHSLIILILLTTIQLLAQKNYALVPTKYFDLIHTDLDLTPVWKTHELKGIATLTIKPYFYPQSEVILDAKAFDIHSIDIESNGINSPLIYNYDTHKLSIILDREYKKGEELTLKISYTAHPDSVKSRDGNAIKEEKGLYFINTDGSRKGVPMHLWTQGETEANSAWFPTFDFPAEKHTQKIKVTYTDSFVSLANGQLISSTHNGDGTKTDIWEMTKPHSVYLSVLVIGNYKIVKDNWRGKEVSYYMEPQYEAMARPIFGRTPEMIEYFSTLLGVDYPWSKYSQVIVHDFVAGAMENTSAVTFNDFVQKDSRELIDDNDDETVAHELFHHWFGDLVTCNSWGNLTLNESFANYSEYLWHEYKDGLEGAELHWKRDMNPYFSRSSKKQEPLVRTQVDKPDDMFDLISYNKGGKILHMLRKTIGDEAFFQSLKLYLTRHAYQSAKYTDLQNAIEETTGKDMSVFFTQWYLKGGHPTIYTHYKTKDSLTTIYIKQKHSFDDSFTYSLPLDIDFYTTTGIKRERIEFNKAYDSFSFPMSNIKAIVVDATNSLVGIQTATKEIDDWIYILKNSTSYIDRSNAVKKLNVYKGKEVVNEAMYQSLYDKNDKIVQDVIKNISDSWLEKDPRWNEKLIKIATENKTGRTRAQAIELLGKNEDKKPFLALVLNALKDSSYIVENAALQVYQDIDSLAALQYALKLSSPRNFDLLMNAYEIIGKTNNPAMTPKFEKAIENTTGYYKIAVYLSYGKFLANMPNNIYDPRIEKFKKLAESKDFVEKYCGQSALKTLNGALATKTDANSKKRLKDITDFIKNMPEVGEE